MNKQHTQLIDRLEASASELADALAQLPADQFARIPKEGEWSLHMVMSHVRDTEVNVFAPRVERILKNDAPPAVPSFNQEEWTRLHYSPDEPLKNIVAEFRGARRKLVKLLRGTRDGDWKRYAIHPEYGNIPIEHIALHSYAHTLEHLQQFMNVREGNLLNAANGK
jgi:hypothetical protein